MSQSEIDQRAVGCGIEGGDVVNWSRFSNEENLIYPPSCLDINGNTFLEKNISLYCKSINKLTNRPIDQLSNRQSNQPTILLCSPKPTDPKERHLSVLRIPYHHH